MYLQLLTNRALANSALGHTQAVISDCCTVLEVDGENIKAVYRRGLAYLAIAE